MANPSWKLIQDTLLDLSLVRTVGCLRELFVAEDGQRPDSERTRGCVRAQEVDGRMTERSVLQFYGRVKEIVSDKHRGEKGKP